MLPSGCGSPEGSGRQPQSSQCGGGTASRSQRPNASVREVRSRYMMTRRPVMCGTNPGSGRRRHPKRSLQITGPSRLAAGYRCLVTTSMSSGTVDDACQQGKVLQDLWARPKVEFERLTARYDWGRLRKRNIEHAKATGTAVTPEGVRFYRPASISRNRSRGTAPAPTNSATARVTALGCSLPTASKPARDRWGLPLD